MSGQQTMTTINILGDLVLQLLALYGAFRLVDDLAARCQRWHLQRLEKRMARPEGSVSSPQACGDGRSKNVAQQEHDRGRKNKN